MAWTNIKDTIFKRVPGIMRVTKCTDESLIIGKLALLWGKSQERLRLDGTRAEIVDWAYLEDFSPEEQDRWIRAFVKEHLLELQPDGRYLIIGNAEECAAIAKRESGRKKGGEATKRYWEAERARRAAELAGNSNEPGPGKDTPPWVGDEQPPPPQEPGPNPAASEPTDSSEIASSYPEAGKDQAPSEEQGGLDEGRRQPLQFTAIQGNANHGTEAVVADSARARDQGKDQGHDPDHDQEHPDYDSGDGFHEEVPHAPVLTKPGGASAAKPMEGGGAPAERDIPCIWDNTLIRAFFAKQEHPPSADAQTAWVHLCGTEPEWVERELVRAIAQWESNSATQHRYAGKLGGATYYLRNFLDDEWKKELARRKEERESEREKAARAAEAKKPRPAGLSDDPGWKERQAAELAAAPAKPETVAAALRAVGAKSTLGGKA